MDLAKIFLLVAVHICACQVSADKPPHILFVVADDLGWHDVGWHGSEIRTPTLDQLATSGVILNHSYVQPICSPTRSSLMSGKFVSHTGMQSLVHSTVPFGLPLNITTIAQQMKARGYATHAVGKWHQGYCKPEYTPSHRGFDSFYGYYSGAEEYFTHLRADHVGNVHWKALDFHYDTPTNFTNVWDKNGSYSANVFAERAISIISKHDASTPLYLYLPFQSVHGPLEVPESYADKYPNIHDKGRRTFAGMVSALDEAVANVTAAFERYGLWNDTVMIFTTDNGGLPSSGGNNWPLRGRKFTLWEGGTRGVAFVHSPMLQKTGYTYNGLVHAVDWYPTLVSLAGGDTKDLDVDGYNIWPHLSGNLTSPRSSFIYLINKEKNSFAIRVGPWKLIINPGTPGKWYPPPNASLENGLSANTDGYALDAFSSEAKKNDSVYLFNLDVDPTEHNNLIDTEKEQLQVMQTHLKEMMEPYAPDLSTFYQPSPKSNPANFGNAVSTGWC